MIDLWFLVALVLGIALLLLSRHYRRREKDTRDLSESLRQKFSLAEQTHQREMKRFLDSFTDPFFSISQKGKIVRFSYAGASFLGDRNLVDRSYQELFIDPELQAVIKGSLKKKQPVSKLIRLAANSPFSAESPGQETSWQIDIRPLAIQGNALEMQLMMRDMTSFVQAEQIRQDFIANASHELRTPLSIISGYLEILTESDGLDSPETAQKMLATMDRHTARINRIVDDMLLISKLESGESAPVIMQPFDLKSCIEDVVERLDLLIEKQKATVSVEIPSIDINGDRFYWTQILFNLIENALKQNVTRPVSVTVSAAQSDSGEIQIQITDDGIGIPSPDLPYIFKRFFRVEKSHGQNETKGTGLGLSIVKRAVEAHRGTITASSTPGIATTFTIKVPSQSNH